MGTENEKNKNTNNPVNPDNSNNSNSSNGSMSAASEFFSRNGRYLIIALLIAAAVAALVFFTSRSGGAKKENKAEDVLSKEYQVDGNEAVTKLMKSYYKAYAAGDVDALKKVATPISEFEQSYIKMFSERVEKYEDIKCYIKEGLDKNSYIVSVTMSMKFPDIDTKVPSLETFYIRTDDKGKLYIDNLYSTFNYIATKEKEVDAAVSDFITAYEKHDDFVKLAEDVEKKSDEALKSDEKLAEYIDNLNNRVIPDWLNDYKEKLEKKEEEEQKKKEEEEQKKKEEEEQKKKEEEEQKKTEKKKDESKENSSAETVYASTSVNIRETADTQGNLVATVDAGTELTRTGTEGDWSIIEYNGTKGYVKSEYLSKEKPQAESSQPAAALGEGSTVTLKETVNVRESMSETAAKVSVGYAGDKVRVIMSYAEGWTKVNHNDKIGYIKTELLQ